VCGRQKDVVKPLSSAVHRFRVRWMGLSSYPYCVMLVAFTPHAVAADVALPAWQQQWSVLRFITLSSSPVFFPSPQYEDILRNWVDEHSPSLTPVMSLKTDVLDKFVTCGVGGGFGSCCLQVEADAVTSPPQPPHSAK
jgi:hypothetical protein